MKAVIAHGIKIAEKDIDAALKAMADWAARHEFRLLEGTSDGASFYALKDVDGKLGYYLSAGWWARGGRNRKKGFYIEAAIFRWRVCPQRHWRFAVPGETLTPRDKEFCRHVDQLHALVRLAQEELAEAVRS